MQAQVKTIEELFQEPVQYVIPQFQRGYDWHKEQQWEPLWDDIRNKAEQIFSADPDTASHVTPHFMGALVLQQEPDPAAYGVPTTLSPRPIIVDGQQRLTSIQILARAIVGVADRLGHDHHVEPLRALITNSDMDPEWRFKVLQCNQRDADAYKRLMAEPKGDKSAPNSALLNHQDGIEACHDFVSQAVSEHLDEVEEQATDHIRALQTAVMQHLQFAVLSLDPDEQPNMVFETLNARGQTLAQHQLVKNHVMMESGVILDAKLAHQCWRSFDDEEWTNAKSSTTHIDRFFSAWLTAIRGKQIQTPRIATEFRAFIDQSKAAGLDTTLAFETMNRAGANYWSILHGKAPHYGQFHQHLDQIGATSPMPMCLWMMEPDNGIDQETTASILATIESYAFRRLLTGHTQPVTVTLYLSVIAALRQAMTSGDHPRDALRDLLTAAETAARPDYWPDDGYLKDHLTYKSAPPVKATKAILERIEQHLRDQEQVPPLPPDTKLFAHRVMPADETQWERDGSWPITGRDRTSRTLKRRTAVATIGNYTLVTTPSNRKSNSDNAPWDAKREMMEQGSPLLINRPLRETPQWDEKDIEERSGLIAQIAANIWPR